MKRKMNYSRQVCVDSVVTAQHDMDEHVGESQWAGGLPSVKRRAGSAVSHSPDSLPGLSTRSPENSCRTKAILAHFVSPGEFHLWLDANHQTYIQLSQQLESYYQQLPRGSLECPEVGTVCAVQWQPGKWGRCTVRCLLDAGNATVSLTDVGSCLTAHHSQLYPLDDRFVSSPKPLVARCALWGIKPAGHITNWSSSSVDRTTSILKSSVALFIQVYHTESTGVNDSLLLIRLYCEFVKEGGPMGYDTTHTVCINDELVESGLALRSSGQPISVQPSDKSWPPSMYLNLEVQVRPLYLDSEARLFFHDASAPWFHLETIGQLLNWYYARSQPTEEEHERWAWEEPCVFRIHSDRSWNRGSVVAADDEKKLATIHLIDHGRNETNVSYSDMRRTLMCFDYPRQAHGIRLAKYPGHGGLPPQEDELEKLRQLLVNKDCVISTKPSVPDHYDIRLVSGKPDMDDVFGRLRPQSLTPATSDDMVISDDSSCSSSVVVLEPRSSKRAPIVIDLESDTSNSSLDFDNCSGPTPSDSELQPSPFLFVENEQTAVFGSISIPFKEFLPVNVVQFDAKDSLAVIQPVRHSQADDSVPSLWLEQADGFARLTVELQRSAPHFPQLDSITHGKPCACFRAKENLWYRGIVIGYAGGSQFKVSVHLVDIGVTFSDLSSYNIKELPEKYILLPRHSITVRFSRPISCRAGQQLIRENRQKTLFRALVKNSSGPHPLMTLFYQDSSGKFVPLVEQY